MVDFGTERLAVQNWTPTLADPEARSALVAALAEMLTLEVLRHLPEPLQLPSKPGAVSEWVDARAAESDVHLVANSSSGDLVGLLILAFDTEDPHQKQCHVGYLLARPAWGHGYATELVVGLVDALRGYGPMTVIGGVDEGNEGSARVLEKAGFRKNAALVETDTIMFILEIE